MGGLRVYDSAGDLQVATVWLAGQLDQVVNA